MTTQLQDQITTSLANFASQIPGGTNSQAYQGIYTATSSTGAFGAIPTSSENA